MEKCPRSFYRLWLIMLLKFLQYLQFVLEYFYFLLEKTYVRIKG